MISVVIIILLSFTILGGLVYFVKRLERESILRKQLAEIISEKEKIEKRDKDMDVTTRLDLDAFDEWMQSKK